MMTTNGATHDPRETAVLPGFLTNKTVLLFFKLKARYTFVFNLVQPNDGQHYYLSLLIC